jgi:hypothetical protein
MAQKDKFCKLYALQKRTVAVAELNATPASKALTSYIDLKRPFKRVFRGD